MSPRLQRLRASALDVLATWLMVMVLAPGFMLIAEHFDGFAAAWRSLLWMAICIAAIRLRDRR